MRTIKVLAFEDQGIPRMLYSASEIAEAIGRGSITAETDTTLYLDNGEKNFDRAAAHPELAGFFAAAEPEPLPAPPAAAPAPAEPIPAMRRARPLPRVLTMPVTQAHSPPIPLRPRPVAMEREPARPGLREMVPAPPAQGEGNLWHWMFLPYRRYFEFEGRSRRKEYWSFTLLMFVLVLGITVSAGSKGLPSLVFTAALLASAVPWLAVHVRRLHDIGASGWLLVVILIPTVGPLAVLVLMLIDGYRKANRFGENPKQIGGDISA